MTTAIISTIAAIDSLGGKNVTVRQLAEALGLKRQSIIDRIDRCREKGLVSESPYKRPKDAKPKVGRPTVRAYGLTASGRKELRKAS